MQVGMKRQRLLKAYSLAAKKAVLHIPSRFAITLDRLRGIKRASHGFQNTSHKTAEILGACWWI